jgi:NTP pyrophosphatase (non-canonical NTP hydrolase)
MNQTEFTAAVRRCCSPNYHVDNVTPHVLMFALQDVVNACQRLDRIKKALFYGQQDAAFRTSLPATIEFNHTNLPADLAHGVIGIATEAGELGSALLTQGTFGTEGNYKEELGDLEWYKALLMDAVALDENDVREANVRKLLQRYPEKFDAHFAKQRNLFAEEQAIAGSDREPLVGP